MTHTTLTASRPLALLVGTILLLSPAVAFSQSATTLVFVPACSLEEGSGEKKSFAGETPDIDTLIPPGDGLSLPCEKFTVRDPQTLETSMLQEGDELSIAIVIENPTNAAISRVRTWIAYDPAILEGKNLEIDDGFPTVTPGESDFAPDEGYVKIGATAKTPSKDARVVVATMTFIVKKTTAAGTSLSFDDSGSGDEKRTLVMAKEAAGEQSLLSAPSGTLAVKLKAQALPTSQPQTTTVTPPAPSSAATVTTPAAPAPEVPAPNAPLKSAAEAGTSSVPAAPATPNATIFPNLQVSNLRVTTQGTAVYLGWNALASGELVGYNVYYGATSGQYLQRKTIDRSETTLTIRNLPENTVYYFSVRGTNAAGVETEFSPEVSVTVSKPETSTAPLSASLIDGPNGKPPKTDGNVAGDTGTASTAALLLIGCAVIGTMIASRRQLIALTSHPDVA